MIKYTVSIIISKGCINVIYELYIEKKEFCYLAVCKFCSVYVQIV